MATAANPVRDADHYIFAFAFAEAFIARQDTCVHCSCQLVAVGFQLCQLLFQIFFACGQIRHLSIGRFFRFVSHPGRGRGFLLGGLGLFHQFQLLVFQFEDVPPGHFNFVGQRAVLVVPLGLKLLEGISLNRLLFRLDLEFKFLAVAFELFAPLPGHVEGCLGGGGFSLKRLALRPDVAQFAPQPGDFAVAVLEDQQFFDGFQHLDIRQVIGQVDASQCGGKSSCANPRFLNV